MKFLKVFATMLLVCAIMCSVVMIAPLNAYAACSHTNLRTNVWSEAVHPHAYYRTCIDCGAHVYVGGYATKNHGDGSWGSGTCPQCGTHTYTGRTCTSPGTCVCGATIAAKGHTPSGPTYSEDTHPHSEYRICMVCGGECYTGTTSWRMHGNGTDDTCADCPYTDISLLAYKQIKNGQIVPRDEYFDTANRRISDFTEKTYSNNFFTSYSEDDFIELLQSTEQLYVHAHGTQHTIQLAPTLSMGMAALDDVDLSSLQFVLLLTCSNAQGGYNKMRVINSEPINILEKILVCGTETVLAFTDETLVDDCNVFAKLFSDAVYREGKTVKDAVDDMYIGLFEGEIYDMCIIGGNKFITLN